MYVFLVSRGYNAEVMPKQMQKLRIFFYDSQCGLCQRSVRLFLFCDRAKRVAFAPLYGQMYKELVPENLLKHDSIIFYQEGQNYIKSDAIIKGISGLGGYYKLFYLLYIIPKKIRDDLYDRIAVRRKKYSCDLEFINHYKKDERFYE